MQRKIALIRGINVGGRRKIGMDVLKSLCEGLGWKNTTSYKNSPIIETPILHQKKQHKIVFH